MPVLGPVPCLATCSYENCTSLGTHHASVSLSENDYQNIASARTSLFDFFYHKSALNTCNRTNTEEGNNTAGLLNRAHNISQQPPTLYRLKVISKDSSLFCRLSTRSSHPAHHCTPISHEKKYLSPQHRVEGAEGKYISLCLPRPFPFQTWKLLGHNKLPEDTSEKREDLPHACSMIRLLPGCVGGLQGKEEKAGLGTWGRRQCARHTGAFTLPSLGPLSL